MKVCGGEPVEIGSVKGTSWVLATTAAQEEERAAAWLKVRGWFAYLPRYRKLLKGVRLDSDGRLKRSHGIGEVVRRPLFPRYIFVRLGEDMQWSPLRDIPGILSLVGSKEGGYFRPSISGGELIVELYETEQSGEFDDVPRPLRIGSEVKLARGPFQDQVGRLASQDETGRVAVMLEVFSRQVRIEARREDLVVGG